MSLNLQEMAFEAMAKLPESRIAAVMRVPPIIARLNVGLDRSTFSNYGEARKAFAQDTLATLWRLVSSEITADLLPSSGMGGVDVRFDLSRWRRSKRTTARVQPDGERLQAGLVTPQRGNRRMLGLGDAATDGDGYYRAGLKPTAAAARRSWRTLPKSSCCWGRLAAGSAVWAAGVVAARAARAAAARSGGGVAPSKADATGSGTWRRRRSGRWCGTSVGSTERRPEGAGRGEADTLDPAIIEQLGLDLGPGRRGSSPDLPAGCCSARLRRAFALDVNIAWDVKTGGPGGPGDLAELIVRITETADGDPGMIGRRSTRVVAGPAGEALVERGDHVAGAGEADRGDGDGDGVQHGGLLAYAQSGWWSRWCGGSRRSTNRRAPDCRALDGRRGRWPTRRSTMGRRIRRIILGTAALAPIIKKGWGLCRL